MAGSKIQRLNSHGVPLADIRRLREWQWVKVKFDTDRKPRVGLVSHKNGDGSRTIFFPKSRPDQAEYLDAETDEIMAIGSDLAIPAL